MQFGSRRLVNVCELPFDPRAQVRFRGRAISELTRDELVEALCQALSEIHRLQQGG